ncbi:MAG: hypothetical protein JO272_12805 [Pseudonocardiales bacterium]|nr:hypothetical protein [Pseudonocardiales bacterium]
MPYLISGLVGAAGAVVLLSVLVWLAGAARRLAGTVHCGRARWAEGTGLLATRIAALRVQLARRGHPNEGSSPSTPAA